MSDKQTIFQMFKQIRVLLGISQKQIADNLGVPQQNYARYEAGISKKIPYTILCSFAKYTGVDEKWLNTGEVNKNYCYEIATTIQLNKLSTKELALKLNVTEDFINAIVQQLVSPSTEFFQKIMRTIGIEPQGDVRSNVEQGVKDLLPGGKDYAKGLLRERDNLREELEEYKGYLGESQFENKKLKAENAELKRRLGIE